MTAQHEICPACRVKLQRKLADVLGIELAGKIDWQAESKSLWVSTAQAAKLLGVSTKTVNEWRVSGKLDCKTKRMGEGGVWLYWYADLEK